MRAQGLLGEGGRLREHRLREHERRVQGCARDQSGGSTLVRTCRFAMMIEELVFPDEPSRGHGDLEGGQGPVSLRQP